LAESLASATLAIGTGTVNTRKPAQPVIPLPELLPVAVTELTAGGRVALVFGPEKHGLTGEDLALCHLIAEIPTDPLQPSMNLGQAVAVFLYELAGRGGDPGALDEGPHSGPVQAPPYAKSGDLDRLEKVIEQTIAASDYSPENMRSANQRDLREMLRRLALSEPDARRAMGLFRRILWRLQHPGPKADPSNRVK
jgi:tRNA/rRNA methyltransferase